MRETSLTYPDAHLRGVLESVHNIAIVGASPDWERPSCYTMQYLQSMGYTIYPVNPNEVGREILGRDVVGNLAEIEAPIDMVSIFRKPQAAGAIVDEAIAVGARVIWMQEGVRDDAAAVRATAAGLSVVMDRCPKKEHFRLFGGSPTAAQLDTDTTAA